MFVLLLGLLLVSCNARFLQMTVLLSIEYQSLAGSIIVESLFMVYLKT